MRMLEDNDKEAKQAVIEHLMKLMDSMHADKLRPSKEDAPAVMALEVKPEAGDDLESKLDVSEPAQLSEEKPEGEESEDPEMLAKLQELYESLKG